MTSEPLNQSINAVLGTIFLVVGGVLALLIFVDRWTEIQLQFPRIWYTSRSFHVALCAAFFTLGWWTHRKATEEPPKPVKPLFESLRFYTKPNCSLCDEALVVLSRFKDELPDPEMVNILDDPELVEKHGEEIPVIELDGTIRFRGIVSEELLKRMITARKEQRIRETIETSTNA